MAEEEVDYAADEARGLAAAFADGSAGEMQLSDILKSAGYAMSNPSAVMAAFGSRAKAADVDTVLARCTDLWADQWLSASRARADAYDSREREERQASTMRSLFRFSTDPDARAVMESAENGDTSPLLAMKERYVFE